MKKPFLEQVTANPKKKDRGPKSDMRNFEEKLVIIREMRVEEDAVRIISSTYRRR